MLNNIIKIARECIFCKKMFISLRMLNLVFFFCVIIILTSCDNYLEEITGINMYSYNGKQKLLKIPVPKGGITFPTGFYDDDTAFVAKPYYLGETQVTMSMYFTIARWAQENKGYENLIILDPQHSYDPNDIDNLYIAYPSYVWWYRSNTGKYFKDLPINGIQYTAAIVWCNAYTEWYNNKFKTNYSPVYVDKNGEPIRKALIPMMPSPENIGGYVGDSFLPCIQIWFDRAHGYYFNYLIEQEGFEKYFNNSPTTGTGFRLPTANEWELAARWNGINILNSVDKTISGIDFSSQLIKFTKGNSASGSDDNIENLNETGKVAIFNLMHYNVSFGLQKPKTKKANALGLYDMSGNLREIVYDVFYIDINKLNIWGRPTGEKVPWPFAQARGGSYCDGLNYNLDALSVGIGIYVDATAFNHFYGFRIARDTD